MGTYEELMNIVNEKNALKSFKEVNECIDSMIEDRNEDGKIKEIKAMICHFEGDLNDTNEISLAAISYALIIGGISLVKDCKIANIVSGILVGVGLLLIFLGKYIVSKVDYKKTFILKLLNFKLEEIINRSENKKETNDYKEYVITVSKK